ncbi:MAG: serine hydrolase domain-containing protein [Cyanobacteria bacterium P01_D01_bin.105]
MSFKQFLNRRGFSTGALIPPVIAGIALSLSSPFAQPSQAIPRPAGRGACHSGLLAEVDSLAQDAAVNKDIPGMTVAVTKDGRLICNRAYGYANWENQTLMQPDSRAQIGSTTKVLVTSAMMKLIQDDGPLSTSTKVYGSNGILSDSDYQNAIRQGVRRHYPIVGLAIGNNVRVNAWYSDGRYTIGSSNDLEAHQGPRPFSLPTGQTMADVIAIARGGPQNQVYSWYRDGSYSIGTASDLDAAGSFLTGEDDTFKSRRKDTIAGISVNEAGDKFYAHYHDGTVTSGSSPADLTNRFNDRTYQVPGDQQRRYNIVDIARSPNGNTLAWYSRGKASRGTVTDLDAHTAPFDYTRREISNSRQHWIDQYESIEIRHLLSHTAGFSRSGDGEQAAIKYDFANFSKATNPAPYKFTNMYTLSTRPLLFDVGTRASYSNHGMGLTGHLISEITGQDWYDYLRQNILIPAGAENIVPRGLYQNALDANPHFVNKNGVIRTNALENFNHSGSAAGSLKASAADLARFMVATDQLGNHPDVLYGNTISRMESRPFPEAAPGRAYGWGVRCQNSDCSNKRLSHNGKTGGGTSYIAKYQDYRIGNTDVDGINVAVVTNSGSAGTGNLRNLAQGIATEAAESSVTVNYDLFVPGTNTLGQ